MGERKGTNKYYPPDFDPKKHGSLAGYHGQHPLRERARKIKQGILIIRFEMPYNIWCDGCNNHIGMGVRYNAEKSKIGMYYTTPIYKFRMKCHLCDNYMEIKTDPANHDYVIISGARRKEQRWDPKENEQVVPEDRASQKKLATDAMYRLEHSSEDKAKLKKAMPGIAQIEEMQLGKRDDYILNKMARNMFRGEKKALKRAADEDQALLQKSSLDLELVEEHQDDVHMAQLLKYRTVNSYDEKQKQKRLEIESRPLFQTAAPKKMDTPASSTSSSSSSTPSPRNNKLQQIQQARNRLGLNTSRKKQNPFGSTYGVSPGGARGLSRADIGIVRKSSKMNVNEVQMDVTPGGEPAQEINKQKTLNTDSDAQLSDNDVNNSGDKISSDLKDNSTDATNLPQQNALNALLSNYDSSENSDG